MLLLATCSATRLALYWTFGRFSLCSTSKLEEKYGEQAQRHIECLYMALKRPEISTKQMGTTCRALYRLVHMLTRIQTEGT